MINAIKRKPFWVNLLVALVIVVLLVFLVLQMLGLFTKHGQYLTVPSVLGKNTTEAIKFLESKGFEVEITDSTYTDTAKNGIVLKQIPDANSTVKVNRTVFLVVNRVVPPMIELPRLEGLSLAFALEQLERNHFKLRDTLFKPDFQVGAVIEVQVNGNKLQPGAKVQWGTPLTLIVGKMDDTQFMVPEVTGLTYAAASRRLDSLGILAVPIPDITIKDSTQYATAIVFTQRPGRFDEAGNPIYVRAGMAMDLFISKTMKVVKDSVAIPKASQEFLEEQQKKLEEERERKRRQKEAEKQKQDKTN